MFIGIITGEELFLFLLRELIKINWTAALGGAHIQWSLPVLDGWEILLVILDALLEARVVAVIFGKSHNVWLEVVLESGFLIW